jgi:hypothetical protein
MTKLREMNQLRLLSLFVILSTITACKDKKQAAPLSIRINYTAGGQPLNYDQVYSYNGMSLKFIQFRFYAGQFSITGSDSKLTTFSDRYVITDPDNPEFVVGNLAPGDYIAIGMGLGVDSSRNTIKGSKAIPAADYPLDNALNVSNNMYWGWNPGYIFMKLEGRFDVNNNGTFGDSVDVNFSYHPGVGDLYRTINRNFSFSMNGEPKTIRIEYDLFRLMNGVDFINYPFAHPSTNMGTEYKQASDLVDNQNSAFGEFQ